LEAVERKVKWLATWTIHNANHIRPNTDGVKVGGHQASCASISTIMTALYFHVLSPRDRVAVKPHAGPVLHAIEYLFGNQTLAKLKNFRGLGGAQSYPSRTKDGDFVDFSTGSVGLGAAVTNFAALTQSYLRHKDILPRDEKPALMVALVGDAEMDEGNIYEALIDTWKHDIRNLWWVIDYNRQSLDSTVNEKLFRIIGRFFRAVGWNVITLKYGKALFEAFQKPGGAALKSWLNDCPNDIYCALTYQGGAAWRTQILADKPGDNALVDLLADYDDAALHALMTDLGGHCMEAVVDAFASVPNDKPTMFLMYTVKGQGLPLAGHKDNHAGLMTQKQMAGYQAGLGVKAGTEWDKHALAGDDERAFQDMVTGAPFNQKSRIHLHTAKPIDIPETLPMDSAPRTSTQVSFGRILNEIAKQGGPLAERIVTTSPDVTVSTNLGGWVNQRGLFHRSEKDDAFQARNIPSAQKWIKSPTGQHIELGIAENNLFINLAALGLSHRIFGERLFPIGTLYDPFIARGLDALNYACYQDARFMLVSTPSGISLAPEGGAHQSISTPLIGMGQPGLLSYEPAYASELATIMRFGFEYMQDEAAGGSIYLRLSTRPLDQPTNDQPKDNLDTDAVLRGAYWRVKPTAKTKRVIAYTGVIAQEAGEACAALKDTALLAITSMDRLYGEWQEKDDQAYIYGLMSAVPSSAKIVSVLDGHPAALAWLGSVCGHQQKTLGVSAFGQTGSVQDLYKTYGIDTAAILRACR
jgi:pyruvate dehydrogenase E1 component